MSAIGTKEPKDKMRMVAVRFPDDQFRRINALSIAWDESFAEIVRRAVQVYFAEMAQ